MGHRGSPRYFCRINSKIEKDELGQRMETTSQGTESLKVLTGDSKSVASETSGVQVAGQQSPSASRGLPSVLTHVLAPHLTSVFRQPENLPHRPASHHVHWYFWKSWKTVSMRSCSSLVPKRCLPSHHHRAISSTFSLAVVCSSCSASGPSTFPEGHGCCVS